jgi:hypothetical protein
MLRVFKRSVPIVLHALSFLAFGFSSVGMDRTWEDVKARNPGSFIFWLVVFIASGVFQIHREASARRAFSKKARIDVTRKLLATLATWFKHIDPKVRTNIMAVSPDGRRRTVQSDTAHNMADDPDDGLEIDFSAGVSGRAARLRKPSFGDLRYSPSPGHPDWGLTLAEQGRIRPSLKSILSVPIFNPDNPEGTLIGTLQVDSDEPMDKIFENAEKVEYVVTAFADALALLLKDGG